MSYQEENAKAEQVAAAFTVGCFVVPIVLVIAVLLIGGLITSMGD